MYGTKALARVFACLFFFLCPMCWGTVYQEVKFAHRIEIMALHSQLVFEGIVTLPTNVEAESVFDNFSNWFKAQSL
jgi:hypothetical protein